MATKYLYGAAVQGIQSFIFQTNELKNIIGASEIVEEICTSAFNEFAAGKESIVRAAGNIKHIFDDQKDCEKAVREFPMKVMGLAPNVTVSQAVFVMKGDAGFAEAVDELEKKLRAQRNKPVSSITVGLMGIKRSPKTGLPVVEVFKEKDKNGKETGNVEWFDAVVKKARGHNEANMKLCGYAFGEKINAKLFPFDIGNITGHNSWIAIIHADGNGLGQIVQKVGKNEKVFQNFSRTLDKATKAAAQDAYATLIEKKIIRQDEIIPIRPVVLDGDDFTMICRADFAVEYAAAFLKAFEERTRMYLGQILVNGNNKVFDSGADHLTACAGIAFIKASYPFYYGYNLAEALCGEAKKIAKSIPNIDLAPSCLMFHKVQDSFIEDFKEIEKRELTTPDGVSFKYGPYYTDTDRQPNVDTLIKDVDELSSENGNKIKSHIRQWMSAMYDGESVAEQKRKRVSSLLPQGSNLQLLFDKATKPVGNSSEDRKSPAYDILSLASVKYQVTKNKEEKNDGKQ